jgi:hypothetical protein
MYHQFPTNLPSFKNKHQKSGPICEYYTTVTFLTMFYCFCATESTIHLLWTTFLPNFTRSIVCTLVDSIHTFFRWLVSLDIWTNLSWIVHKEVWTRSLNLFSLIYSSKILMITWYNYISSALFRQKQNKEIRLLLYFVSDERLKS